jgi:hypothetical protein
MEEKYTNKTGKEILKLYEELAEQGWTPISIKGKPSGDISRYDMTWDSDRIGAWYFWFGQTTEEFKEKKAEMQKLGLKLDQENSWTVGGVEKWAGIWVRPPDPRRLIAKFGDKTLVHARGHIWELKSGNKVVGTFKETLRTEDFVELYCKADDSTVRIYMDRVEVKAPKKKTFVPDVAGGGFGKGTTDPMGSGKGDPNKPQPHIRYAIFELQEARTELSDAGHNFGGHRAKALDKTDVAIKQLNKAVEFCGDQRPFKGDPNVAPGEKYKTYPHMNHALKELKDAVAEMRDAKHDYGGHRTAALDATLAAIAEIELALKFAKK